MASKALFITQEITPYVPESDMSREGRYLPAAIQSRGTNEIRTFMPLWGTVNERRNQLHEVIRLSGLNIPIDDSDHSLLIKVATLQPARMQVYFIDNEDYFRKRKMRCDGNGKEYRDNHERAVFYARGVLETMKKLRWYPELVHCQGWMTSIAPLYIRNVFHDEPAFANCKIVYSMFKEDLTLTPPENILECLRLNDVTPEMLEKLDIDFTKPDCLSRLGILYADAVISTEADPELVEYARKLGKPVLEVTADCDYEACYTDFYNNEIFG